MYRYNTTITTTTTTTKSSNHIHHSYSGSNNDAERCRARWRPKGCAHGASVSSLMDLGMVVLGQTVIPIILI